MRKILSSLFIFILLSSSLIGAPSVIVFDFGGVMTEKFDRQAIVDFLQHSFHLTPSEYEKVNREKHKALKQGKTDEEFWMAYAQEKGIVITCEWVNSFKVVMKEAMRINPKMYELVEDLKKKPVPVAMLSNVDTRLASLIREFGYYKPFDPLLLSYELGIEKPDPKAYEILLKKLSFQPNEVVFIDDKPENVEAAKKMGIDAILFVSEPQLRAELVKRGVLEEAPAIAH